MTVAEVLDIADGPPAPEFTVLGAAAVPYAATPTLVFTMGVTEPAGLEVYTIALSAQIHVDPVKRTYDAATREKLVELFGAPERWAATTHSFVWAREDVLVPRFTGTGTFELTVPCSYDMELAATRYFAALPDGEVPLSFHYNGTIFYPAADGRMQLTLIPWSTSTTWQMSVAIWRDMINAHYPHRGWIPLHVDTLAAVMRFRAQRGLPTYDACLTTLLGENQRDA